MVFTLRSGSCLPGSQAETKRQILSSKEKHHHQIGSRIHLPLNTKTLRASSMQLDHLTVLGGGSEDAKVEKAVRRALPADVDLCR